MDVSAQNLSGVPVELPVLEELAIYVLGRLGASATAEIGVALVDEEKMAELNREYRSVDSSTDVLAFDLSDGAELSGEVVISPQVAARQALGEGMSTMDEIKELLIHGLLHLLGYDHQEEAAADAMYEKQLSLKTSFDDRGATAKQ